jgi:hypothetical protein
MRTREDDVDHKKDEAISLFKALMIPVSLSFSFSSIIIMSIS